MQSRICVLFFISVIVVSACGVVDAAAAPKAPAKPASSDYSSKLNHLPVWSKSGYKVSTPFKKTTVYGRDAYVGAVSKQRNTYHVLVFPAHTYKSALTYRDQLVHSFKALGYRTHSIQKSNGVSYWVGSFGNTLVWVGGGYTDAHNRGPATTVMAASR